MTSQRDALIKLTVDVARAVNNEKGVAAAFSARLASDDLTAIVEQLHGG